jgi:histidinol-phosphate aminotransferase
MNSKTTRMKPQISRRDWLKSTLALTSGLALSGLPSRHLIAGSVSEAEKSFTRFNSVGKVKLNFNENPYGLSEKAKQAILQALSQSNRYPIDEMDELKAQIARKEGVSVEYIHVGAGSGDILCQTGAAFGLEGGRVISAFPTFSLLMNYAELFKAKWDKVNLNTRLEHDYDAMASAIKDDTRLIFICNPNNPSGTLVDPQQVKAFCEEVGSKVPVYADEAYLEFLEPADQLSMVELVKKDRNVIVSRTFSKIHGMAGMRIGYIVARPDLVKKISAFEHDIPVSAPAIAAAKACLGDENFMKMTRDKNIQARAVLTNYLDQHRIEYGKSHTNFVFFPAPKPGRYILSEMEKRGYLIRIWDYQQREWCRVSIGTLEEMNGFVKAFAEVTT